MAKAPAAALTNWQRHQSTAEARRTRSFFGGRSLGRPSQLARKAPRPPRLRGALEALVGFFQLAINGACGNAEELRREVLVAFGLAQCFADDAELDLFHRRAERDRQRAAFDRAGQARGPRGLRAADRRPHA